MKEWSINMKRKLTSRWVDEQTAEQKLHVVVAEVEGHCLGNNIRMLATSMWRVNQHDATAQLACWSSM